MIKQVLSYMILTLGIIYQLVIVVAIFMCSLVAIVVCWETLRRKYIDVKFTRSVQG